MATTDEILAAVRQVDERLEALCQALFGTPDPGSLGPQPEDEPALTCPACAAAGRPIANCPTCRGTGVEV